MNPENLSSDRPEAGKPPGLNSCAGRQGCTGGDLQIQATKGDAVIRLVRVIKLK